jgi:transposase-like protein
MLSEKLLTLREACRGLGVHPNTLRKWGREGIDVNEKSIDLAVIKPGKVRFGI